MSSNFRFYQGGPGWLYDPATGAIGYQNRSTGVDVELLSVQTTVAPNLNRVVAKSNNTTGKAAVGDIITVSAPPGVLLSNIQGMQDKSSTGGSATATIAGFTSASYALTSAEIPPLGSTWPITVYASTSNEMADPLVISNPNIIVPPVATLRQVASGTHLANYISTANKYIGVTSEHTMADSVSSFKLAYANFRVATGEVDGAAMTASVGIEYPVGTYTRVMFGGAAQGNFAAGAVVESDAIGISIPAGAKFKIHAKLGWPTGFFIATSDMSYHASTRFSAGAADGDIPDYSLGGGEWNAPAVNTTSYVHTPVAIVAMSTKPCVGLLGSSTPRGFGDLSIDNYGITGYLSRAISPTNAVMNIAVSGDSFTNSQNSRSKRLGLLKYCTHVVASIGTNDIYGTPAWNSTQVINAYTALVAAIDPTKKTWIALYQPRNTGTWTSQGGQTINATFEGYRVAVNNAVKAGIPGAAGYVDGLSASESNVNPENGLWRTDLGASTIDGIHMNSPCAIRAAALVPVSAIVNS